MAQSILLVEDEASQRLGMVRMVKESGYAVQEAANGKEALYFLRERADIALVLLDLRMPEMDGMATLKAMREIHSRLPVIIITASDALQDAVTAMQLGASDFISKPVELERLQVSIQNALRITMLSGELERLQRERSGAMRFSDLIGYDGGLAKEVALGKKAAQSDIPVLINGESGAGKELFAHAIHGESHRAGKPFVAVNCGAIPEKLVESTLFGHEKGAFTGAVSKTIGKFREADGGTLFLDEIGELPPEAQVKLLRVLQQKEVEPVGAARPTKVDVRILSATNRDLRQAVAKGQFREDLYFRLNVFPITLPSLDARREDIPALVEYFIRRFAATENKPISGISREALALLSSRSWPGNVRELENALFRAVVMSENNMLNKNDFNHLEILDIYDNPIPGKLTTNVINLLTDSGEIKLLETLEQEAIRFALAQCGNNVAEAAKCLGLSQATLYRRLGEQKRAISD